MTAARMYLKGASMQNKEIANRLGDLIKLDTDAVHAYDQAIGAIAEEAIQEQLTVYKDDHQRHIEVLSRVISDLRETPPKASPDLKGFALQGFTAVRSITGTSGALKAMKSNELLTNRKYDEARSWDVDAQIKDILESHYQEEQMHLRFVENALRDFA